MEEFLEPNPWFRFSLQIGHKKGDWLCGNLLGLIIVGVTCAPPLVSQQKLLSPHNSEYVKMARIPNKVFTA